MKTKIIQLGVLSTLILYACSGQKFASLDEEGQNAAIIEQRELINTHIKDPANRDKLLTILSEAEQESMDFYLFYQAHQSRINTLNHNFKAARQDFEKEFVAFNDQYEKHLRMLVSKREEMRLVTTSEEWQKINDRKISYIPKQF